MESVNISQTRTIVPRLHYSNSLLAKIIDVLKHKKSKAKKSNKILLAEYEDQDPTCTKAIDLYYIQKRIDGVSRIDEIPKTFPSLVPMIRTISAQLVDIHPESSQHLSELSVHLGSIVLDSATITTAQFDFSQSNVESSLMLDEVKLMVDSKINKQYPHLDFF
jgi:glucokinase